MKKIYLLSLGLTISILTQAQVGINTQDPKTTLHVLPTKTDGSTAEGIIAPNLTRSQLISKDSKYTATEKGAIVYVTDLSGTLTTKTTKVTQIGYYYFDGATWQTFSSGNIVFPTIPTEPWQKQGTTTPATSNTEDIYQQGNVAIGTTATTATSAYTLDVNGTSNVSGNSTVGGTLDVTKETTLKDALTVKGTTNTKATNITGTLNYKPGGTAPTANQVLTSDANGNATWGTAQSLITIPTEPWRVQGATTAATTNTQNIYQTGSVGIGASTAVPTAYKFQVTGASNITGNSTVASSTVTGNESIGGTLTVTGASSLNNTLTVAGTTNLNGQTNTKATTVTGQLRYTIGTPAANKVLISSDANGNATWGTAQSLITIPTEPWLVQGGTTAATTNAQNIYQTGSVGIGASTAVPTAYKFQVTGASNVTGNSTVASSTVTGNETIGGTLTVTGASSLKNTLTVAGTTNLNGTTNTKATNITGTLNYKPGGTAPTANTFMTTDASGNASWKALPTTATTEPWLVQGGTTTATTNAQNIYQTGSVGIGASTAVPTAYKFQVTGASNITGNSTVASSTVTGNETIGGTLTVTGASSLKNTLTVAGTTNLNGQTNTKATTVTGQLRYTIGTPAANKVLISSDANGNATWGTAQSLITIPTEPWLVQGGTTAATTNAQNIYQTGSVGIGASTAVPTAYKFQVTGASNVTGNSTVASSTVKGNESIGGTLTVTGASSLNSTLTVAGTTNLNGTTNTKATNITGTLNYKPGGTAPTANTFMTTDASGNASWKALPTTATTEPWQVQGATTAATTNAQNIYQTGSVGIGASTAVPTAYKFQVTGASNITGNSTVASSTVTGNESIGGTLTVTGASSLKNTLTVAGTTNLNGSTNAKATNITGTLNYKPGGTAPTANTFMTTDASGNASWKALPTTATTEPWQVQGATTAATTNAQNIYQKGNVGIGTATSNTYNASAQLELADTNKGFLPNRVALTSASVKAPVTNAVAGMLVYNTATVAAQNILPGFYYWNGTNWTRLVPETKSTTLSVLNLSKEVTISVSAPNKILGGQALAFPQIEIAEDGAYAFSFRLYGTIDGAASTRQAFYIGTIKNGTLVSDAAEVDIVTDKGGNNQYSYSVTLGGEFKKGDKVTISMSKFGGSSNWTLKANSDNTNPVRTSLVWWKL